ncbi:hypothetical protein E7744_04570 [Citricoccus sp. SGAir0253]|uniref:hypothetical protein n=1 Tax=Citricoccus sp. SGAir0253 TaxID=2567881 RepID=UPI0010CD06B9|nr:hypothetical protein [Citricoccus sp. SGAir0253]QCU77572.1 hypothetical protein E7744_04570 [Citricoccus sp. SGAir0253]
MAPLRSMNLLRSLLTATLDQELGCSRRRSPGGFRCPNTFMLREARAAGHEGFCSPECADAQGGDPRGVQLA